MLMFITIYHYLLGPGRCWIRQQYSTLRAYIMALGLGVV